MAIVQISRITNRKGLLENLPQPLAAAELGWAADARRLFIGNGDPIEDGAPLVGNTEILTEFSDLLSFSTAYTYTGEAATGYVVQTGPTPGTPITQSLQARLDSYAIVTDFGAKGDGITDCTAAINRALYQLYCVDNNVAVRRSLFFPAGRYLITGTLYVPAFATLYGEGVNGSIISLVVEAWTDTVAYQTGVLVANGGTYYRSQAQVPVGTSISDTAFWVEEAEPHYIVQTADSLQQTGVDIASNGATAPQAISIVNLNFETNLEINGLLVEDSVDCEFNTVRFSGPLLAADIGSGSPDISAVCWSSTPALTCQNITFTNCSYSGFKWGSNVEEEIRSVVFTRSTFDTLYQGIRLGTGATGVRVLHNTFDNIYYQGIIFEDVSLNTSGYNIFYDVGNELNGMDYPASEIIRIESSNNLSVGDMFERTNAIVESGGFKRIVLVNAVSIATDNGASLQLGAYTRNSGVKTQLTNNASNATFLTVSSEIRAFNFNYTITRDSYVRTGVVTVVASSDGAGTDLIIDDSGFQNNGVTGVGVTFTATETDSIITVKYSSTNTGVTPNIYYSYTQLA